MSCGMVVTSFQPQTPAVLPTPPNILEGFSKTKRYASLSPGLWFSPLLTWAISEQHRCVRTRVNQCLRYLMFFPRTAELLAVLKAWSQSPRSVRELATHMPLCKVRHYIATQAHIGFTDGVTTSSELAVVSTILSACPLSIYPCTHSYLCGRAGIYRLGVLHSRSVHTFLVSERISFFGNMRCLSNFRGASTPRSHLEHWPYEF